MGPYVPKGHILLRDAIVRLAVRRSPDVEVRAYLARPPSLPEGFAFSPKWRSSSIPPDPFLAPPKTGRFVDERLDWPSGTILAPELAPCPAWDALEAAKADLRQALGDGDLEAYRFDDRSELVRIPAADWRGPYGLSALHLGQQDDGLFVFLPEKSIGHWSAKPAAAGPVRRFSQARLVEWLTRHMSDNPNAGRGAIAACMEANGASRSAARAAYRSVPDHLKGQVGKRKAASK